MKTIKKEVTINGVKAVMLFTPRLFSFKTESMDFSVGGSSEKIVGMYADLFYLAALNYWTLCDKDVEAFELNRVDFHEWSAAEPREFGKVMRIAVEALTNKSLDDLIKEEAKPESNEGGEVKKKTCSSIMERLRRIWSAIVD